MCAENLPSRPPFCEVEVEIMHILVGGKFQVPPWPVWDMPIRDVLAAGHLSSIANLSSH